MVIKKSELYSSLWASCDELRGGMDAGQVEVHESVVRERHADWRGTLFQIIKTQQEY